MKYPSLPWPIYCWLCGETLEGGSWATKSPPPFVFEKPEWKQPWDKWFQNPRARKRKFFIDMNASDLAINFKAPYTWLVLSYHKEENQQLPPGYHLSGIGYMPGSRTPSGYFLAGRDPASACLGGARVNAQTLQVTSIPHPFSDYTCHRGLLKGLVLHSRCWDLIEMRLGPRAASRLDLISAALEHHFEKRHDPLFIPEVSRLVQACARFSETVEVQRRSMDSGKTHYSNNAFPPEIYYFVADHLNLADTYSMLLAFGLRFPTSYWKRHIPTDLIFELENVNDKTFPWDYAAVELEKRNILHGSLG
ncbi:hypothetical protein AJ79_07509, partial [Helicocarpus griseus UAMH5409]